MALCLSITPVVSQEAKGDISPEASARIARFSFNFLFGFVAGAYCEELHEKPQITHGYKEVPIVVGGELVNQIMYPIVFAPNNQKYTVIKPHHEYDFLGRGLGRALAAVAASGLRKKDAQNSHINMLNVVNSDLIIGGLGIIGKQLSNWYQGKPQETEKQSQEQPELSFIYQKHDSIKDIINPNPQPKPENVKPVSPVTSVHHKQDAKASDNVARGERDFLLLGDLT